MTNEKIDIVDVEVSKIAFAPWNPNEMATDKFDMLVADMKANGPGNIDPIVIMPAPKEHKEGRTYTSEPYVVIDGNHRLKAAKALKWKDIRARVTKELTEDDAMIMSFQKNMERGALNPFREAEMFKQLLDGGMKQDDLAKQLNVDRTLISHRISLLKIEEPVRVKMQKLVPNATVSHLEVLATASKEVQERVLKYVASDQFGYSYQVQRKDISVDILKGVRDDQEQEYKRAQEFKKLVEDPNAKFPKCPTCGKEPIEIYDKAPFVQCAERHNWSMKTGKGRWDSNRDEQDHAATPQRTISKPDYPNYVRTTHETKEFIAAFLNYVKEVMPTVDSIDSFKLSGKKNGKYISLSVDAIGLIVRLDHQEGGSYYSVGNKVKALNVEEKKYNSEALKEYKAVVTGNKTLKNDKDAEALNNELLAFLKKYGAKPSKKKA